MSFSLKKSPSYFAGVTTTPPPSSCLKGPPPLVRPSLTASLTTGEPGDVVDDGQKPQPKFKSAKRLQFQDE